MPISWTPPETFTLTACGHTGSFKELCIEAIRANDKCLICQTPFTMEDCYFLEYGPDLRTPEEIAAVEEKYRRNAILQAEAIKKNERARIRRAQLKVERENVEAETKRLVTRPSSYGPSARDLRMAKRNA